jgi:membrane protein implicated in regulation of membrane protease activity
MCHHPHVTAGLLVLAVVALLAALFLPWWAIALGGALAAGSTYLVAQRVQVALRRRARVGPESLPGASATVVATAEPSAALPYVVRLGGELWSARSPEPLAVGDQALVLGVEDNHLVVCRMPPELQETGNEPNPPAPFPPREGGELPAPSPDATRLTHLGRGPG